jgi:hypothetical protein
MLQCTSDPDLAHDTRIAAPIIVDDEGIVTYWATGGIRLQRVKYEYKREPAVGNSVTPAYIPGYYYLPTDLTLEFQRSGSLTRADFQRICNSCGDENSLRKLLRAPDHTITEEIWTNIRVGVDILLLGFVFFTVWKLRRVFSRRVVLSGLAVVALLFAGWIARMSLDLGYRTRFFITQVACRNSILAAAYRGWHYPIWYQEVTPPEVLGVLVGLLRDPNPQIRYLAVSYLETASYHQGVNILNLSAVEGAEDNLRAIAMESDAVLATPALSLLGFFDDEPNIEFLRAKLNGRTNDPTVRRDALYGLARTGDSRAIGDVIACTKETDVTLRKIAIMQLGNFDDQRGVDIIAQILQSSDEASSEDALFALDLFGKLHPKHDISSKTDPALLAAAGNTGFPSRYREELAMSISDVPTQVQAYENLLEFPGSKYGESFTWCQTDAVDWLKSFHSAAKSALPMLQKMLQDPRTDPRLRGDLRDAIKSISQ